MRRTLFYLLAATALVQPGLATAQRSERVLPARVAIAPTCPLTPSTAIEQADARESILPMLAASVLSNLVGQGVNALATALDNAARERGFVAEGTTGFYFHEIRRPTGTARLAQAAQRNLCVILFRPGPEPTADPDVEIDPLPDPAELLAAISGDAQLRRLSTGANALNIFTSGRVQGDAVSALIAAGVTRRPSLYIEAVLLPRREGLIVQPLLVWYGDRMSRSAPSDMAESELHVSLATPGSGASATDIGAIFAAARLVLPPVRPGAVHGPDALRFHRSVIIPTRPTTGAVETLLGQYNNDITAVVTRAEEHAAAERALDAAVRARNAQSNFATNEAVRVATDTERRAGLALAAAQSAAASRLQVDTGATNIKARFVVIREANRFLQAISTALGAQRETIQTAVRDWIAPAPAWDPARTTLIEAEEAVNAKEREIQAASADGDAAAIARLNSELRVLRARWNQAAAAANRDVPFPALLPGEPQ